MKQKIIKEKTFEVRDLRHKEKFMVDDYYLNGYAKKVGVYATAVYLSLCRHADKKQKSFPSLNRIAEQHGISVRQVSRALNILEKQNIICRERIGKKATNRYYLKDKSEWTDSLYTMDSQSNHFSGNKASDRTHSLVHSKDSKDTQRRKSSFKKPYYSGLEVREAQGKTWVIPEGGGKWLEFVGRKEDIEYKEIRKT